MSPFLLLQMRVVCNDAGFVQPRSLIPDLPLSKLFDSIITSPQKGISNKRSNAHQDL